MNLLCIIYLTVEAIVILRKQKTSQYTQLQSPRLAPPVGQPVKYKTKRSITSQGSKNVVIQILYV